MHPLILNIFARKFSLSDKKCSRKYVWCRSTHQHICVFFTQIVARWRHRLYILIHKTVTCYSLTGFLGLQSIFPRQTIRVLVVTLLPTCLYSFSISLCFFLPKKRINIYTLCPKYVVHQSHGNRYGIVEFNVPLDTL